EHHGTQAQGFGFLDGGLQRLLGGGDHRGGHARETRVARLRRFFPGGLQVLDGGGGFADVVLVENRQCIGNGGRVRNRRAGGHDRRIVARHTRDQQPRD